MRIAMMVLAAVLGAMFTVPAAAAGLVPGPSDLKVTILSTMLADAIDDEAYSSLGEWGFSALVEVGGRSYLYDTGYHPELVMENARKLGIDLAKVEHVVLSHAHADHVGGLVALRKAMMARNPRALSTVHVANGFFAKPEDTDKSDRDEAIAVIAAFRSTGGVVVVHEGPAQLAPGVWLTGPVPRTHDEKNWSGSVRMIRAGAAIEDTVPEDMALVVETTEGLTVVSGCGHAGIVNIADHALAIARAGRVSALLGGFHLFEASHDRLQWTASHLKRLGVTHLIGAHCTGVEATFRLREMLGLDRANAVVGAVGQRYTEDGIATGWIAR